MDAIRNNWNRYRWSCIAGIGCAFIIGMLPLTDFLERWELRTHDLRFHLRCPRASHARIVIAEINEDTCKVWPEPVSFWGGHYAAIIRNAHRLNAKWIGLDILEKTSVDDYLEMLLLGMLQETKIGAKLSPTDLDKIDASAQLHPEREFARAMEEVGPCVILPYALSKEGVIEGEAASLPEAAYNQGFVNLPPQLDDVVRTTNLIYQADQAAVTKASNQTSPSPFEGMAAKTSPSPYEGEGRGGMVSIALSFDALLAARALGAPAGQELRAIQTLLGLSGPAQGSGTLWINYTGQPFPRIPAQVLATAEANPTLNSQLQNAIVLIGITDSSSKDLHRIPGGRELSGVEIHAQILATLLDKRPLHRWGRSSEAMLTAACALITAVFVLLLSFGRGFVVVTLLTAAWWSASLRAFASADLLLPMVGPLLGMTMPFLAYHTLRSLEEGRHRRQIERLFGRYVSPQIRDFLLRSPTHLKLGGTQYEASVLFFDIRGSSLLAQGRDPGVVIEELNDLFREVVPVLDRHGGLLTKYTGDGFLAVFGAPYALQNHAQAAVDAALQIVQAVQHLNIRSSPNHESWKVGCGIHSGLIVCGNLGVAERSEFTVIGDTVNVAARLEEMNKQSGSAVTFSQATCDLLDSSPPANGPFVKEIRGRSGELCVYHVPASVG